MKFYQNKQLKIKPGVLVLTILAIQKEVKSIKRKLKLDLILCQL